MTIRSATLLRNLTGEQRRVVERQLQAEDKRARKAYGILPPSYKRGYLPWPGSVTWPLVMPSLANMGGRLCDKLRVKAIHKQTTTDILGAYILPPLPARITITRIGRRLLDSDNLTISAKHVRDAIAALYGVDDGSISYEWIVDQENGEYGVRVRIDKVEPTVSRATPRRCRPA